MTSSIFALMVALIVQPQFLLGNAIVSNDTDMRLIDRHHSWAALHNSSFT